MARLTQSETLLPDHAARERALAQALDAIEIELAGLEPGASADFISQALEGPVRALGAASAALLGDNQEGNA